jgi:hypothetical protein
MGDLSPARNGPVEGGVTGEKRPSAGSPAMASIRIDRPPRARVGLPNRIARLPLVRELAADARWLVPIVLVVYVLAMTRTWNFPDWRGIPFPPVWLGLAAVMLAGWRRLGHPVAAVPVAGVVAMSAMLMTDVTAFWTQPLRDLGLYLKAGEAWLAGAPVYDRVPLAVRPPDLTNYPFLYPPLTLPLFGALASLPLALTATLWLGVSLAAVLAALRWIGLRWWWCVAFLAWPPVLQGLYVGNVAVPLFALFAAAAWRPALLAIPPIFKPYSGIAALWLLRREHWRQLLVGAAVVVAMVLVTLPLTGLQLWSDWVEGLRVYQVSQRLLPDSLYGFGLGRYVPAAVVAVVAIVVTVLALRTRDRLEQLARLGVATVVASPSLFSHGWLVAVPGLVALRTPWFWLAFGLTACAPGLAWFVAVVVVVASWFWPAMRKTAGDDAWHPLGAETRAWSLPPSIGLRVADEGAAGRDGTTMPLGAVVRDGPPTPDGSRTPHGPPIPIGVATPDGERPAGASSGANAR